jgi:hypothetical protein
MISTTNQFIEFAQEGGARLKTAKKGKKTTKRKTTKRKTTKRKTAKRSR